MSFYYGLVILLHAQTGEDTWLNEGFATYGEALYIENINNNNKNEFHRYMGLLQDRYTDQVCNYDECLVVTNRDKYPDQLFDEH